MYLDRSLHLRDKLRRLGSDLEGKFSSGGEDQYRDLAFRRGCLEEGLESWEEEGNRFAGTCFRLNEAISGKVS